VDASEHRELGTRYDVSGFPTLKFVPKGSKDAVAYESGREVADLVAFMNEKAGLAYTADGGLKPSYGRVAALDALVSAGGITADTVKKVQAAAGTLEAAQKKFGELYVKAAEKVAAKGAGYVDTELARLEKMLDGGNVSPDKAAAFKLKANVLKAFKGEPASDATEEL
jgi:protein disulfide-isomerase A6